MKRNDPKPRSSEIACVVENETKKVEKSHFIYRQPQTQRPNELPNHKYFS